MFFLRGSLMWMIVGSLILCLCAVIFYFRPDNLVASLQGTLQCTIALTLDSCGLQLAPADTYLIWVSCTPQRSTTHYGLNLLNQRFSFTRPQKVSQKYYFGLMKMLKDMPACHWPADEGNGLIFYEDSNKVLTINPFMAYCLSSNWTSRDALLL